MVERLPLLVCVNSNDKERKDYYANKLPANIYDFRS